MCAARKCPHLVQIGYSPDNLTSSDAQLAVPALLLSPYSFAIWRRVGARRCADADSRCEQVGRGSTPAVPSGFFEIRLSRTCPVRCA